MTANEVHKSSLLITPCNLMGRNLRPLDVIKEQKELHPMIVKEVINGYNCKGVLNEHLPEI